MQAADGAVERLLNPDSAPKRRGRKPGSKSTQVLRRVLRAQDLINQGRAPINVMLRNMWWWDELAEELGKQMLQNSEALRFAQSDDVKLEALTKFNENLAKFFLARDKAQSCAADAAPYFHARLQAIKIDATVSNVTPQKLSKDAPEEKFIEGYSSLINESYRAKDFDQQPEMADAAED